MTADWIVIGQRMLTLINDGMCQADAFHEATRLEAERLKADLGEVRVGMLNWIRDHAIYTADGGWSIQPALEKLSRQSE